MLDGSSVSQVVFENEALHLTYGASATASGYTTFEDTTLDGGGMLVLTGSISVSGDNSWDDVQFNGTLTGSGNVTVTDELDWTGGSLEGTGAITIASTALLDINASSDVALQQSLNTYGLAVLEGSGNVQFGNDAVWENFSSGELDLRADLGFLGATGSNDGTFINGGLFVKMSTTGESMLGLGVTFDNDGSVDVQTGTLHIQGGGTNSGVLGVESDATLKIGGGYTLTSASQTGGAGAVEFTNDGVGSVVTVGGTITGGQGITIDSGAEIAGAATLDGEVTNSGTIDVGGINSVGIVAITGDYTQTASGQLNFTLDGTTAGTDYSQLTVTGTATLGGKASIVSLAGYTPAVNSSYSLITYASVAGSFASVTSPFDPTYGSTAFSVTYVLVT
jgi:hypothetical protein